MTERNENVQNCLSFDQKNNNTFWREILFFINKKETNDACLFVGQQICTHFAQENNATLTYVVYYTHKYSQKVSLQCIWRKKTRLLRLYIL